MLIFNDSKFSKAMDRLVQGETWATDFETTGLKITDRICGAAIKILGDRKSYYFPIRHREGWNISGTQRDQLLSVMSTKVLLGYNVSAFDTRFGRRDGLGWCTTRDVMLGAFLVNENEGRGRYNLEAVANKYLGEEHTVQQRRLVHELTSRLLTKGDIWRLPPNIVEPYACEDVELAEKLYDFYAPHLYRQGLVDVWYELSEYAQIMGLMMERGLPVDVEACQEALIHSRGQLGEIAIGIFEKEGRAIKVNSPQAAARWLGVKSTTEDELDRLGMSDDWRVQAMRKYRKYQRAGSAYYEPMLRLAPDGFYHTDISLIGTVTGRPAWWGGKGTMNALAIPRDTEMYKVKKCIRAPEGMAFIEADYKGAEMRLATHYAREARMKAVLAKGNPHQITADDLRMPYDSAKRINFSVIYGIGPRTLAHNLNTAWDVAERWLNAYHRRYPGFKKFFYSADRVAQRRGYIKMWTGRRRHYNRGQDKTPTHKAADHIIQGGVNELIRVKQTELHHALGDVRQIHQVYDSMLMLCPKDVVKKRAKEVREIVTHRGFWVPMEVDIKIGQNLEEMEVV